MSANKQMELPSCNRKGRHTKRSYCTDQIKKHGGAVQYMDGTNSKDTVSTKIEQRKHGRLYQIQTLRQKGRALMNRMIDLHC